MRSINVPLVVIGLMITLVVLAGGCVDTAPPQDASDAANVTAESLFLSFNTGDYRQFSGHFSDVMKSSINESAFSDMRNQVHGKYGNYTSKTLSQSWTDQKYSSFVYDCTFSDGKLKIRVVTNATDLPTVEGLWFPNGV